MPERALCYLGRAKLLGQDSPIILRLKEIPNLSLWISSTIYFSSRHAAQLQRAIQESRLMVALLSSVDSFWDHSSPQAFISSGERCDGLGRQCFTSQPLIIQWWEPGPMATPSCKGDWELSPGQGSHTPATMFTPRTRDSKLQPNGLILESPGFINRVLLEHSHPYPFIYILSMAAFQLQRQTWAVMAKTLWMQSLKYLLFGPL